MDFVNHDYLDARNPYDYTFNFWNDYLGLSTLVARPRPASLGAPPGNPNSITQSLKASLGLDDCPAAPAPPCPCVTAAADCCCCPPASPPLSATSVLDLKERFSILSPFQSPFGAPLLPTEREAGGGGCCFGGGGGGGGGGSLAGFDLFGAERRMRKATAAPRGGKQEPKICVFCRNNGAPEEVFGSHVLKTAEGRVVCPILRAYTCPLCSANGDNAHTIKYCPLSKEQPAQRALKGGRAVGGKRMKIF
ncbi:hypothetical protein NHX12_010816 [Muraenolepis orangiensis]|uniref:Nanos-type domain-containing protein n=1 Tax=Muraenolepis orangiensis TaxID=630683 RepID=A0A9Q0I720_9TELE|nr:hypothetical protein NHX12_010816 [Muraenolepis orangiensis]